MTMNISGEDVLRKFRAGEQYMARGWRVFVLGWEKRPLGNCQACKPENAGWTHDAEACDCLTCHGFYAATVDRDRLWQMLCVCPEGMLAIRTGQASGVWALDAESAEKSGEGQEAGVDVLDNFEHWTGVELKETLGQKTGSGGVHLLFSLPAGIRITSRRVLPNVDIKADGGYIAVGPGGDGRHWINWRSRAGTVAVPSPDLLTWAQDVKGISPGSSGKSTSAILAHRAANVVPAGMRYEFTQKITFMIRKQALQNKHSLEDALALCRTYWEKYEQPEGDFYPFARVEYEMNRAWHRVESEQPLSLRLRAWMDKQQRVKSEDSK